MRKTSYPDIIINAIARRRIVELRYKGIKRRVRPHILGYAGEGALALSAWQIAGTGSGWRLFHVDEISDLAQTEAGFRSPARGYNPNDPAFSRIIERL
ncbi:putative DNA-binding transcriptional regulator YafY [Neorhizobium galegae]|uniref:WYL domain-containing protein n=1 Tax=Neorhizobium galegae TaxID=399 RepID=UPI00277E4093|nr:WYL domain-containing protein [Neorhizobium galegae]MDQ0133393.1 putative DNA-binding transcriptional regulator YafY [Neorhizobium galegae]